MNTLPTLFVSHGAPLFATQPGTTGPALRRWAEQYPKPRSILVMSPHWMARTPLVMASPAPQTYHDFGGFPQELYELQYPAPGNPALAQEVVDLLHAAGIDAGLDTRRPFDHGAWVPLLHMFPQADVPVVQVALPAHWGPTEVFKLGQAVQGLRERGVLIMGSGSMTHNLGEFFGGEREPDPYVIEFSRWVEDALVRGDTAALRDYRSLAPHALRAHPSEDHFLPLFFALGAAGPEARPAYISREVMHSMLAMDAFALQAAA